MTQLMNTPPEAYAEALAYARVSLAGIVFIDMYNAVSAVLRGMGDAKHPFYFIGFAALLNIVLDLLFVPCWAWAPAVRPSPRCSARD